MASRRSGIFCVEGPWGKLTDKSSVRPLLEILDGQNLMPFIHRDAANVEELEHYLNTWTQKQFANFDLGYLAFHGDRGLAEIGRKRYTLERLGEFLAGRLAGRTHFGACAILDVDRDEAREFLALTKARAICGYTNDVDWIESAAFDLNLFQNVVGRPRIDTGFNRLRRDHAGACDHLGLRAMWRTGEIW
jgi:hypothetical protein